MKDIFDGVIGAIELLVSFDKEIYRIVFLSLYVSLTSTFISGVIGIPLGIIIGTKEFKLKKVLVRILYTFMSLPPVIVGLFVFIILSRKGPMGFLGILFTPTAMILAQTLLITPIIIGIVYNSAKEKGEHIKKIGKTLGASRFLILLLLIGELRINIFTAIITGLGRAISEVGAVMIVGGNIKGHTRVMTTTIAMLQGMGEYSTAIALGIILLLLAFSINSVLYFFQQVK